MEMGAEAVAEGGFVTSAAQIRVRGLSCSHQKKANCIFGLRYAHALL